MHQNPCHLIPQSKPSLYFVSARVARVLVFLLLLQVQVKAADNSINKEAREALVEGFSVALTSHIPSLEGDRCVLRQGLELLVQ